MRASGCVRGARGGAGARTGRSRERSGGGERGGGGGCVPAGPSRARRKERRPLGAARDLDRDPPRGSGRRKRELRGRVSGRRWQWEEQEGGPGAGRGEQVAGQGALCPFPELSPRRPEAEARAREPQARGWGAAVRGVGVPQPRFNKGRVAPARGRPRDRGPAPGTRILGGLPFHSFPHVFQRSAAWCMRGPQQRGGGGDGSGRGAGVAWALVRRDSLS